MQSQLVKQILKGDSVRLVQQFAELFLKRRIMKYPIEVKGSRYNECCVDRQSDGRDDHSAPAAPRKTVSGAFGNNGEQYRHGSENIR